MAIITQSMEYNNIPVRVEINNRTARIEVYGVGQGSFGLGGKLLFSSDGKGSDWNIPDLIALTNSYNRVNGKQSTTKQIEKAFYLDEYKDFNDVRASVLNAQQSYDTVPESTLRRLGFFKQETPGIFNPNTGLNVNSKGNTTKLAIEPKSSNSGPIPIKVVPHDSTDTTNSGGNIDPLEPSSSTDTTKTITPSISNVGLLRYPLANLEAAEALGITYDYIKISIQDWKSSIVGGDKGYKAKDTLVTTASKRYKQSKGTLGTIILPMTNNLASTNGVNWGEANANAIQMAMMASVNNFLQDPGDTGIVDSLKQFATNSLQGATGLLTDAIKNKPAVASLLAGYVIGNTSMATRASGKTINPNMELLFNGPKLRTFGFNFQFAPRFKKEAETVRTIVHTLKRFSAPEIDKAGGIFLKTPKIFQLEYIYNGDGSDVASGQTHPYLNKIKPCALINVGVNYTPQGKYMTYADGGSMVYTTMTLNFTEIEPIYQNDYTDDDHPGY
jgi:hypothetical protein